VPTGIAQSLPHVDNSRSATKISKNFFRLLRRTGRGSSAISQAFAGSGQEFFNAAVLSMAVAMLMWHNAWMVRHGREIAAEMRRVGHDMSEGVKPLTALAVVVGLAVLREGSEVVLFLYGIFTSGTSGMALLIGGILDVIAGAAFTALTYFGLLAIPTRYIFSVTSWLIALLAAGLAAQAVQFLSNGGVAVVLDKTMWNTSWLLSENSILGRLLHTLIGYTTCYNRFVRWRRAGVWAKIMSTLAGAIPRPTIRGTTVFKKRMASTTK